MTSYVTKKADSRRIVKLQGALLHIFWHVSSREIAKEEDRVGQQRRDVTKDYCTCLLLCQAIKFFEYN